jgi:preprotein translocase subunit SecG
MITLITSIHIFAIFLLIVVVLMQSGKGAEISASFGGSSQTVFGSSGGANFFTRLTGILAAIFMITSVVLTILQNQASRSSVFEGVNIPRSAAPAAPISAAPGAPATTASTTTAPAQNATAPITAPATANEPAHAVAQPKSAEVQIGGTPKQAAPVKPGLSAAPANGSTKK